jgi:hypothetical protein
VDCSFDFSVDLVVVLFVHFAFEFPVNFVLISQQIMRTIPRDRNPLKKRSASPVQYPQCSLPGIDELNADGISDSFVLIANFFTLFSPHSNVTISSFLSP